MQKSVCKQFTVFRFDFDEVCPSKNEIMTFLSASQSGKTETLEVAVDEILLQLSDNKDIEGAYTVKNIAISALNAGKKIEKYLNDASCLALFACTAGKMFTDLTKKYNSEDDLLEAYIVDAIGSLTVEKTMDRIQSELEKKVARQGLKTTNRYSPGYCNWALEGQKKLFAEMGELPVNICLSEYCLMYPIKSVSGIIGIGKEVRKMKYACAICNDKNCIYRNIIQRNEEDENTK